MCFTLYLGSDKERPVSNWDEKYPRFYVENINSAFTGENRDESIRLIKQHFSKQIIYYVGSHEGCGCGFRRENYVCLDKKTLLKTAENQRNLYEYISRCLTDEITIELYGCWAGDEAEPADLTRKLKVEELIRNDFFFDEGEFTVVEK